MRSPIGTNSPCAFATTLNETRGARREPVRDVDDTADPTDEQRPDQNPKCDVRDHVPGSPWIPLPFLGLGQQSANGLRAQGLAGARFFANPLALAATICYEPGSPAIPR